MNKKFLIGLGCFISLLYADINQVAINATKSVQQRINHSHWSYSGDSGPEYWGDLKDEYFMCKEGKNQSPINLNNMVEANLPKLNINYSGNAESIINNGHTIQVNTLGKNSIIMDGIKFTLKQFHFHTPSENKIDGKQYPMEAHFVHADKNGNLLVLALMYEEGEEENRGLKKVIEQLPKEKHHKEALKEMFNPGDLLPKKLDYYRFNGSLTTPPCSEGVRWIVIKKPVIATKAQLDVMRKILGKNNRPIQPLNARVILK
ncbi:carbonic anhydrase [Nitrosophilus kaiyonis]|uniref:carbonic anhydrase n=1 Tax=Nitrosophilus kaiyonis TaxID=2930200 RepID=UPI002490D526|nr:carbonic anhydrase family protein [Nitrosophilus kaiyonis]